jgi:hypothetical protein
MVIGVGADVCIAGVEQQPNGHSMVEEGCRIVTTVSEQRPNSVACAILLILY